MPRFTTIAAAVLLSTVPLSTFAASVDVYGKIDTALHIQKTEAKALSSQCRTKPLVSDSVLRKN